MLYLVFYGPLGSLCSFEETDNYEDIYSWVNYATVLGLDILFLHDEKQYRRAEANPDDYKVINEKLVYIKQFGVI